MTKTEWVCVGTCIRAIKGPDFVGIVINPTNARTPLLCCEVWCSEYNMGLIDK